MRVEFSLHLKDKSNVISIRKDAEGISRRYLQGISSGALYVDAHSEIMSKECVDGFQKQAEEKTIYLLHPHTDDLLSNHIGMIDPDQSYVNDNNEWVTTFRLWDDSDIQKGIPKFNVEKATDFYNQRTGKGVYKKPTAIEQLSVQGLFDESKHLRIENGIRIIDWVELDGVSTVTKGAYPQENFTVAQKILKQFDLSKKKAKNNVLKSKIEKENSIEDYYITSWQLESNFNETKEEILTNQNISSEDKKRLLLELLNEYNDLLLSNLESINYTLEQGEVAMNKKRKNIDEEIEALTETNEPEVINKEEDENVEKEELSVEESPDNDGKVLVDLDTLEEMVNKIISKKKMEDDNVEMSKDASDDGIADDIPDEIEIAKEDEDVEKSDELEKDDEIEKVAKKLGLSKKEKQELYLKKELNKLPKTFLNALKNSDVKINELTKELNSLKKGYQYLLAGHEAVTNSLLDTSVDVETPVVNKIVKSNVSKFEKQDGVDAMNNKQKQTNEHYSSFHAIRKTLKGMV